MYRIDVNTHSIRKADSCVPVPVEAFIAPTGERVAVPRGFRPGSVLPLRPLPPRAPWGEFYLPTGWVPVEGTGAILSPEEGAAWYRDATAAACSAVPGLCPENVAEFHRKVGGFGPQNYENSNHHPAAAGDRAMWDATETEGQRVPLPEYEGGHATRAALRRLIVDIARWGRRYRDRSPYHPVFGPGRQREVVCPHPLP